MDCDPDLFAGIAPASKCQISSYHYPKPMRYVWHHILPRTCGGQTVADNLAELCDTCHYAVHALLWELAQSGGVLPADPRNNRKRAAIAVDGYQRAVAAGTVANIPNEGSSTPE